MAGSAWAALGRGEKRSVEGEGGGRVAAGLTDAGQAMPCQPTGLSSGPGTTCSLGLGQPGPADHRGLPCLVRAKIACFVSGRRASGCMDIYRCNHSSVSPAPWVLQGRLELFWLASCR